MNETVGTSGLILNEPLLWERGCTCENCSPVLIPRLEMS